MGDLTDCQNLTVFINLYVSEWELHEQMHNLSHTWHILDCPGRCSFCCL